VFASVAHLLNLDLDIVFVDTTSTYWELDSPDDLAELADPVDDDELRNRWDELTATGDPGRACRRRLHALSDQAQLDRERAERWCLVRAVDDALWGHEHQAPGFAAIAWDIAEALH
jgi:hypothetical protein